MRFLFRKPGRGKLGQSEQQALYANLLTEYASLAQQRGKMVHSSPALPGQPTESLQYEVSEGQMPPRLQQEGILLLTIDYNAPIHQKETGQIWPETVSLTLIKADGTNPILSFTRSEPDGTIAADVYMAGESTASLEMAGLSDEERGRIIREVIEGADIHRTGREAKYAERVQDFFKTRELTAQDIAVLRLVLTELQSLKA